MPIGHQTFGLFTTWLTKYLHLQVTLMSSSNVANQSSWCGAPQGSILSAFLFLVYINYHYSTCAEASARGMPAWRGQETGKESHMTTKLKIFNIQVNSLKNISLNSKGCSFFISVYWCNFHCLYDNLYDTYTSIR